MTPAPTQAAAGAEPALEVRGLEGRFGARIVFQGVDFTVQPGEIFAIMGGSGCGKSTLLRHCMGLLEPTHGSVRILGEDFTAASARRRDSILARVGIAFQAAALWSSMTLEENVALPLEEHAGLSPAEASRVARLKLALVGLSGYEHYAPADLSGGMRKRAAFARALALDPGLLLFDEPSAGLDPLASLRLDELILRIREATGAAVVLVSHELPTLLSIVDHSILLDAADRSIIARGRPKDLLHNSADPRVRAFLSRGASEP